MRRARSIRAWLLGLCAALLLIVAGVQLLFGTSLARAYFLGQKKAEMETFFSYIRANYTDDTAVLFELLREGEDVQNIRVAIYDGDGRLLYTTRAMHEAFGALPRFPDGESGVTFSETPEAVELPARSDEDAQLSLAGTFSHQGETRYVLLWVLVASVESSLQAFSRVSLWIVAAVLAAGSLASFLIARKISRPIREIRHVSRQMAGLDFSARADETAPVAELRDLAVSVNRMAEQLSAAVTELRADVDRQRRLEQMQREFVANVSHDMKTPLCLLQMYAENLKNNVAGIDKDYHCDTIIDETARLSEMVGSMLQLSAVESGLAGAERLPLDLGQLCSQALARLAPVLTDVRLETALAGAWPVTGDGVAFAVTLPRRRE